MPFIEGQVTFAAIDWSKPPYDRPTTWTGSNHDQMMKDGSVQCNYKIMRTIYPGFLCPSNPLAREITGENQWTENPPSNSWAVSQCDYAVNIGDYRNVTGIGWGQTNHVSVEGGNATAGNSVTKVRGVIGMCGWAASFGEISDGLSNTYLLGECIGTLSYWQSWGVECFAPTAHPIRGHVRAQIAHQATKNAYNCALDARIGHDL